jgi:hypothetical protein
MLAVKASDRLDHLQVGVGQKSADWCWISGAVFKGFRPRRVLPSGADWHSILVRSEDQNAPIWVDCAVFGSLFQTRNEKSLGIIDAYSKGEFKSGASWLI